MRDRVRWKNEYLSHSADCNQVCRTNRLFYRRAASCTRVSGRGVSYPEREREERGDEEQS